MHAKTELPHQSGSSIAFRIILITTLTLGVFLRIASTNFERIPGAGDEAAYINSAHSLIKNGFFTLDHSGKMASGEVEPQPSIAAAPGFPLYLAAIFSMAGENTKILILQNLLLSIFALITSALIITSIKIKHWCKLAAIAGISVYPGFIYNTDRILTEQLFLLLFLLFFLSFLHGLRQGSIWSFILAGIFIGYATQVRAFALPFFLLACVIAFIFRNGTARQSLIAILSMATPFLMIMAAYWLYSWTTFNRIYWLPASGDSPLIWGAMPYFIDMNLAEKMSLSQLLRMNIETMPEIFWKWRAFGFLQFMWGDIWDENLSHPFWYLRGLLWMQPLVVIPSLIAIPLAIRRHQPETIMIASVPLAFTLISMPFHGLPRYVWPSMPFVFMALAIILDRLSGGAAHIFKFQERLSRACSTWMHRLFLTISIPFSIFIAYSTYIFAWTINQQMSEVRLIRHIKTPSIKIEESSPISSKILTPDNLSIGNSHRAGNKIHIKNVDEPLIIRFKENLPQLGEAGSTVTKITIRSKGGYVYDRMTIYWIGRKSKEISENSVYGMFPINPFQKEHTVYIDDDVTNVLIVPIRFGDKFKLKNIQVDKYKLNSL